ncbi:FGGY-family carbohydrate kinase [Flavihumibacter petaseus]|uniref:Putative sugar kinase n=1 Tax=Flavihumibacter petaseus NBRC 106054 TaxID=1220578 RepID=A0A0E9N172_9BACT|nr:FGGY family carbohydrate kinase [Flavihumibacter petaseus]GAO43100.1 putative sugar kinase [Flavihumibacter petaseus NBRC 106054]
MRAVENVVAVFDIGKTNKKLLVFNEDYEPVLEESSQFAETADEDGFSCDDIAAIGNWVKESMRRLIHSSAFRLKAVNFSTYGASLVHVDQQGKRVTPLYNYLKDYPAELLEQFLATYGGAEQIGTSTATPFTGHLNTGLQLYWLKHRRPELFAQISRTLHFPQYLSYLLTGENYAELTNLGCHSGLWDFRKKQYHPWLQAERILHKLARVTSGSEVSVVAVDGVSVQVGRGLHDSSAALVPYLRQFSDPFTVISTGTWSISLNPFNPELPNAQELAQGCLSYLSYKGDPVKASMLFAGNDHDQQVKRIAAHFLVDAAFYQQLPYQPGETSGESERQQYYYNGGVQPSVFGSRDLSSFSDVTAAYRCLLQDIIAQQVISTRQVLGNVRIQRILVDGGFGRNEWFMRLLGAALPDKEVMAASMLQGTAMGTAMAIHDHWNTKPLPDNAIKLKRIS